MRVSIVDAVQIVFFFALFVGGGYFLLHDPLDKGTTQSESISLKTMEKSDAENDLLNVKGTGEEPVALPNSSENKNQKTNPAPTANTPPPSQPLIIDTSVVKSVSTTENKNTESGIPKLPSPTPEVDTTITTPEILPLSSFKTYISAGATCDVGARDKIITEDSKAILSRSSCTSWKSEVSCYETNNLHVATKGTKAVVYTSPISHNQMPPFLLRKEGDQWKIDFVFMAQHIAFTGSGKCAYPWNWKSENGKETVCSLAQGACE